MESAIRRLMGGLLVAVLLAACGFQESPPSMPPSPTVEASPAAVSPTAAPTVAPLPASPAATTASVVTTPSPEAAEAVGTDGLLVNLATDDTWSANMALDLATKAREQGMAPVIIFLNVRGVYLADRERLPATGGNSKMNIHEKFQAFIAAGGQVIACPSCSREAGLKQEDYIDGVVIGEPGGILRFLGDPNVQVISYLERHKR